MPVKGICGVEQAALMSSSNKGPQMEDQLTKPKFNEAQQAMIDAGYPPSLFLTLEERKKAWEDNPPKPMPAFSTLPKDATDQETLKLLAEMEQAKKVKTKSRIQKMLDKKVDRTGQRWDGRKGKWVKEDITAKVEQAMISITTNTRGATKMTTKPYADMSMAELVEIYNKHSGKPPIKKFETRTLGLKRLEAMEITKAVKEVKENKPKTAKIEKPAKAAKTEKPVKTGILGEFGFREDSPREKLLIAFNDNLGKMVTIENLASRVLGSKSTDNVKMINTLLAGVTWRIKVSELAYEVKKDKTDGVVSLGLFKKK